jgi:hypothetical protein
MTNKDEGYQRLAAGIVKRAIVDYRKAQANIKLLEARGTVLRLTNRGKYERILTNYIMEIESIEQFILSPYFGLLTSTNPELLIKTLRGEGHNYGCKSVPKSG